MVLRQISSLIFLRANIDKSPAVIGSPGGLKGSEQPSRQPWWHWNGNMLLEGSRPWHES